MSLQEAEDELQAQAEEARAKHAELRRQCNTELGLVRGDLRSTETDLRKVRAGICFGSLLLSARNFPGVRVMGCPPCRRRKAAGAWSWS